MNGNLVPSIQVCGVNMDTSLAVLRGLKVGICLSSLPGLLLLFFPSSFLFLLLSNSLSLPSGRELSLRLPFPDVGWHCRLLEALA